MNNALATTEPASLLEQVVIHGDLGKLTPTDRVNYYTRVCQSLGLNPLTKPFEYMRLNGKEVFYAKRDCTDQLRRIHNVSITDISTQNIKDVYIVTVKAESAGRTDSATGVVTIGSLSGDALANALMKCETKAKRRVTLSICGLGWLDETELDTIPKEKPQGSLRDRVMQQVVVEQVACPPMVEGNGTSRVPALSGPAPITVDEVGPLPAEDVPLSNPPVALPPPPDNDALQQFQRGLLTGVTKKPNPTKKGQPWGEVTFELMNGRSVTATAFGFSNDLTFEQVQTMIGETIDFSVTPASNPKFKPTLEHFYPVLEEGPAQ